MGFRTNYARQLAALVLTGISAPGWAADKTITSPVKKADRIVIAKSAHAMTLMNGGQVLKAYKVALGRPLGVKKQQGMGRLS